MTDSASTLFILFFHCFRSYFYQGKEGNGEALHCYVFAEVHHLQITILPVIWFGNKKTEEGRLSSDKASKIMALGAISPSPQILFVCIPGFQALFSLSVVLAPGWIQSTCTGFCKKMSTHSMYIPRQLGASSTLRCNACIQLPEVYTGICQQEEDVADRFHTY